MRRGRVGETIANGGRLGGGVVVVDTAQSGVGRTSSKYAVVVAEERHNPFAANFGQGNPMEVRHEILPLTCS